MHTPDNWVILKVNSNTGEILYKVLAGWSGSYLNGTSWQLNSGIIKVEEEENHFLFHGYSGSVYKCHKEQYCLRMNNIHIWERLHEKYRDQVKLMDEDTNWKNLIEENN